MPYRSGLGGIYFLYKILNIASAPLSPNPAYGIIMNASITYPVVRLLVLLMTFLAVTAYTTQAQHPASEDQKILLTKYDTARITKTILRANALRFQKPDTAFHLLQKSFQESSAIGFDVGNIHVLYCLSIIYMKQGSFHKAVELSLLGLSYCSRSDSNMKYATGLLNNIGSVYMALGQYESALQYYLKAIRSASEWPYTISPISIYTNVGHVLSNVRQHDRALQYLNRAEEEARRKNTTAILATILVNKGQVYHRTGDGQKALDNYFEALPLAQTAHIPEIHLSALRNIGDHYLSQDMPGKALTYLEEASKIHVGVNPWYRNSVLIALGECYIKLGHDKQAIKYLREAGENARQYQLEEQEERIHQHLTALYEEKGDYRNAYRHHQTQSRLKDKLINETSLKNINQLEVRYKTVEKDKELAQHQLVIVQQENKLKKKNTLIGSVGAGIFILATISVLIYKNNQQKQKLKDEKIHNLHQQQELVRFKSVIEGEEKERSRIARELHDGIVGKISAVKLNFTAMQKRHQELIDFHDFQQAMQQLDETIHEIRETAHNLVPESLVHTGLEYGLYNYCQNINRNLSFNLDFQVFGVIPRFQADFELAVYRIVQELIQNIIKHARARNAIVQINYQNDLFSITAEDDGVGFNKNAIGSGGIGLKNLRSRIKAFTGSIDVNSDKNGTTVYIEFETHHLTESGQTIAV